MPIIEVSNISKKYNIVHQKGDGYITLRDVLTNFTKHPFKSAKNIIKQKLGIGIEEFWALKDINFSVKKGEILGIIGPNGAGKSTLLKILSQITPPTTGEIKMKGRVGSLLEVGTGFNPELTGRENVYLNGAILGMTKKEISNKFNDIVEFSGVEKFIDTPVKRYSSGMKVRLGFSVAAHLEPDILLVDEVLAVGDVEFQKKCLGKMDEVTKKAGRTILFVSHNMIAVQNLCKRCILLNKGKIKLIGKTKKVVNSYLNKSINKKLSQRWNFKNAPGNGLVRIKSIELTSIKGNGDGFMSVNTPLQFTFRFWYLKDEGSINITMHLFGLGAQCIFASPSPIKKIKKGLVEFTCQIPKNFLNAGKYYMDILIVENSSSIFNLKRGCVFEIRDVKRKGCWFGEWPGVIRPKFSWQAKQIN